MPAVSKRQQAFMAMELARKRAGKKTRTGMTEGQLKDYATTPSAKLPPVKDKPHGSGEFTDDDMRRGYKKGQAVDFEKMKCEDLHGHNAEPDYTFDDKD